MEFKSTAVDTPPPAPTPVATSYPVTTVGYVSHLSMQGGFSNMIPCPIPNSIQMPLNNASEALWLRQLEKEQIRREIIASEIDRRRRRELEEEVRRELAMERGWGTPMAAAPHGFSYEERVSTERVSTMRLNPSTNLYDDNPRLYPLVQQLPQLMLPAEVRPSSETNYDKVINLGSAKFQSPSQYTFGTHAWPPQPQPQPQPQVAQLVAPAEEVWPSSETNDDKVIKLGSVKVPPPGPQKVDTVACSQPQLLQGVAPTEEFKPSAVITNDKDVKLGFVGRHPYQYRFDNKAWPQPQLQLPERMAPAEFKPSPETSKDKVIKLAKPDPNRYDAKRKAKSAPDVDGSNRLPSGLKKKPKEEWSCAVCQVSATSDKGLKEHLQGKKHMAKENKLRRKKTVSSTSTSSSSSLKKSEKCDNPMDTAASGLDEKADRPPLQSFVAPGDINQTLTDRAAVESKNEEQLMLKDVKSNGINNATSGLNAKADSPCLQSGIGLGDLTQTLASRCAVGSENEEQPMQKIINLNEPTDFQKYAKAVEQSLKWRNIAETMVDKSAVESKNEEQRMPKIMKLNESVDIATLRPGIMWGDATETVAYKGVADSKNEEEPVQRNQNIDSLKKENLTAQGQEVSKQLAPFKKGKQMKYWCEMCQVGALSQVVMESHKKGKKHLARMKYRQNNGSALPTSSEPVEASGLIKDAGAVNEEAVANMESSSHDSHMKHV